MTLEATTEAVETTATTTDATTTAQATTATETTAAAKPDAAATETTESKSALATETDPAAKPSTPADWPEDWRAKLAGGDEDLQKLVNRYTSPANIAKALRDAQTRIRSGVQKPDADDEKAMAEWRKAQGVPEKPDGYKIPEVSGYKWSDADKPAVANFFEVAHKSGLSQGQAEQALGWYANYARELQAKQFEVDKAAFGAAEKDLLTEWGPEYRANKTLAARYLETVPELGVKIAEARLPDGRRLGDTPGFIKWASQQGRMTYGDAAFIGADGQSTASARKAEIEKVMSTDYAAYESDRAMQAEYGKIIEAEQRTRR